MLVGLVLVALVLLAAVSSRSGLTGAVALAVVSLLWLRVNRSAEGPVLWALSSQHGLAATDLAGVAGLWVAARRGWRIWQRRGLTREASAEPPQW